MKENGMWHGKGSGDEALARDIRLDMALESQEPVADLVGSLPDAPLSMEWQSRLNERLLELQPKPKRPTFVLLGATAVAACALAAALYVSPGTRVPSDAAATSGTGIEDMMISAHRTQMAKDDLGVYSPADSEQL